MGKIALALILVDNIAEFENDSEDKSMITWKTIRITTWKDIWVNNEKVQDGGNYLQSANICMMDQMDFYYASWFCDIDPGGCYPVKYQIQQTQSKGDQRFEPPIIQAVTLDKRLWLLISWHVPVPPFHPHWWRFKFHVGFVLDWMSFSLYAPGFTKGTLEENQVACNRTKR